MNTVVLTKFKNAIAALVLVFCAGVANGQPDTAQEDPNTPPQSGEQRDVQSQATPEAETVTVPVPVPIPDQSPFDYRSSEKISEDRSVSFPVDI